jgi:CheY-like chemotaxis protein
MSIKVVVVDDNENNLLLEKDLLEVAGFTVITAVDATEGIILARQEHPDLIVLDIRLPDMRGSEAAMILRKDEQTRNIPIVFVTASVMQEGKDEIKAIPNSTFIGKPINTRTFVNDIKHFYETGEADYE